MNLQLRAALLMLASTVGFGLMAVCIRLASQTEPVAEIAFFRNLFGLAGLLPVLAWPALRGGGAAAHLRQVLRTTQLRRYFIRCLIGMVSMWMGFWAIANLPLAQAVSLAYSSPIFVTIAAVLLLGERVRVRRWLAVVAGFIGVLVIVRPWSHAFSTGSLVAVGAVWTRALKLGEVSALTPISFVQLVIVTIAGWLWFDERVDRWTALGAAIIFAATAYIAHREAVLARQHRSNAPSEAVEPGN